jgi:hypothetical protein
MRALADAEQVRSFMQALGERSRGPGRVYFTGGATAVLYGWRTSTVDIDLKMDPEPAGAFEAIGALKDELNVNVELAAPDQFIPVLTDWSARSIFIGRAGQVDFFHYDLLGQAMSKIERGHDRDLADVDEMVARRLVSLSDMETYFESVEARLVRYPAIDRVAFAQKIAAFLERRRT